MKSNRLHIALMGLVLLIAGYGCKKGGLEWKQVQKIETYTKNRLNKILFVGNTGFIAGGSRFLEANIMTTQDGGNNWVLNSYPESGKGMYGIAAAPSGRVMSIGFDGKILYSDDKGNTWHFVQLSPWYSYKEIAFKSDNTGLIIGGNSFNSGIIIRIDKDGNSLGYDSLGIELNKIEMADDNTGYISCYGAVMKTTDGGKTWGYLGVKNDNFTGIHIHNQSEIWVCGIAGSIFHSKDAGANWEKYRNGNSLANGNYTLKDIYFVDGQNGWAVGEKGLVIQTTDGGKNWKEYKSFTKDALFDICPTPDGNLMVAGENGCLYKLYIK